MSGMNIKGRILKVNKFYKLFSQMIVELRQNEYNYKISWQCPFQYSGLGEICA